MAEKRSDPRMESSNPRALRRLVLVALVSLAMWALLVAVGVAIVNASEPWPSVCRVIQPEDLDRWPG